MAATPGTARAHDSRTGLIVAMSGTAPAAWTWNLTELDRVSSGYYPRLMQAADSISDDGGSVRTTITIAQKGPHRVTLAGVVTRYYTASHVVAALVLEKAAITITQRYVGADDRVDNVADLVGEVVQVTHVGANSITLEVELRAGIANAPIPKTDVKSGVGFTLKEIPAESIGESVPALLGRFQRYLGAAFANDTSLSSRRSFFPFRPNVTPGVEVRRLATSSYFAYADYAGDLYLGDPSNANVGLQAAYIYDQQSDEYAYVWADTGNIAFGTYNSPYISKCHIASIPTRPWVQLCVRPKIISQITGAPIDPHYAIDGSPLTYMKLGQNQAVYFDIPQIGQRGRLSQNSTNGGVGAYDYDGVNAPPGISVIVIVAAPPGQTLTAGSITAQVVMPLTTDALFGLSPTSIALPTAVGTASLATLVLPFTTTGAVGGSNDGWGGTSFHKGQFLSCPGSNTNDPDYPLHGTGANNGRAEALRIKLTGSASAVTGYVVGVWFCMGYRHNTEGWQPARRFVSDHKHDLSGRVTRAKHYVIDAYGDFPTDNLPTVALEYGRHGWVRHSIGTVARKKRERPALTNVYFSSGGVADDGSGTYGGTAGRILSHPCDQARYALVGSYGAEASSITASGAFGSFTNARNNLNSWAALIPGLSKYETDNPVLAKSDVNETIQAIQDANPPLFIKRGRDGAWRAHVWYPGAASWAHDLFSFAIDARRHLLPGPQGPIIEFAWTRSADVVNDLTVNYGWDPGAGRFLYTARANKDDYDDGQGGAWIDPLPGGGAALLPMLGWSQARYGTRELEGGLDLHGVRDGRMAAVIGSIVLAQRYRTVPTLRMTCSSALAGMESGHVFQFVRAGLEAFGFYSPIAGFNWEAGYWRCTRSEKRTSGATTQYIEAMWMPSTIGGEVSGFAGGDEGGTL